MQKITYPEEVEVLYMLPAIRRELALHLKERGLGQGEIALILRVSEPSISHYLKAKRATKVVFSESEKEEIRKSAEKLIHDNKLLVEETEHLLHLMKNNRFTCKVCMDVTEMSKDCAVCFKAKSVGNSGSADRSDNWYSESDNGHSDNEHIDKNGCHDGGNNGQQTNGQ